MRRLKEDEQLALRDEKCDRKKKPREKKSCYNGKCKARWIKGEWGEVCNLGILDETAFFS